MDRLQLSLSAAQHNIASLRTAASDHSALLSALHEQLAEKAGRVLQLEECQQDQERQLAALHNRVKVSCTCVLCRLAPLPPHTSHTTAPCLVPPVQAQRAGCVPGGGGG